VAKAPVCKRCGKPILDPTSHHKQSVDIPTAGGRVISGEDDYHRDPCWTEELMEKHSGPLLPPSK
jgi:hypothetical protein